jgi:hypothetical protein
LPTSGSGWAQICHPFHPLRGRRFVVLKQRRVAGVDTLILRDAEYGSLTVPMHWTDRAPPSAHERLGNSPGRLDLDRLCELVELIELLSLRAQQRLAK